MVNRYIWISIFAIAMGFMESAVVVYLREILYPNGFNFPLTPISRHLALTEIFREAATLIMLAGIGVVTGRNKAEKFGVFLFAFAVWDIFYYIFLKLLLDWPASLLTWDILFLIPTTWTGPVLSPVLVSLVMISFGVAISLASDKNKGVVIEKTEWYLLITGSLVLVVSFCWDYSTFVLQHYSFSQLWSLSQEELTRVGVKYVPEAFNWWLFTGGLVIICIAILRFSKKQFW